MKVIELTEGLRTTRSSQSYEAYINSLLDREIESIGSGGWGTTFQHPELSNIVVKVFANDPGYSRWLRWIAAHQNNPYVPQIVSQDNDSVRVYNYHGVDSSGKSVNQRIGIVFLERLRNITHYELSQLAHKILDYTDTTDYYNLAAQYLNNPQRQRGGILMQLSHEQWADIAANANRGVADRNLRADPHLAEIAALFAQWIQNKEFGQLDLAQRNIMVRWNGHPVFIDPFAQRMKRDRPY